MTLSAKPEIKSNDQDLKKDDAEETSKEASAANEKDTSKGKNIMSERTNASRKPRHAK